MKKIEIKTLFDFEFASAPGVSPDGKSIAYVVTRSDYEENRYLGDLCLIDAASGKSRRLTSRGDARGYTWTKDGKLLFSAMRDDKLKKKAESGEPITAFYELDPCGGEAELAFTLPLSGARLNPIDTDRYIVAAGWDNTLPDLSTMSDEEKAKVLKERKESPCEVLTEYPFWENGGGFTSGQRNRLFLYTRSTGELKPITGEWEDCYAATLSPSGRKFAIMPSEWRGFSDYKKREPILLVDTETLERREIFPAIMANVSGYDFLDEDTMIIAATEGKKYSFLEDPNFYLLDLKSGEWRKIADYEHTVGYGSVGTDAHFGGGIGAKVHNGEFYFVSTVGDGCAVYKIDRDGHISEALTPDGACSSFDISDDGKFVYCGMYGQKLDEIYLDGRQITNSSAALDGFDVRTPEPHVFTNSDGVEIHGWALTPSGYEKGRKYPAILHIHGGPETTFHTVYHHEMQMWANAGYFVFFCNPRGSDGRGNEFSDIWGKYGTIDYSDIMEFADEMLKKYPDADEKNFGVTGGSYGGFMTNWIIGHTDRFKAACSQRSIASWISFEHTTDIGVLFTELHQKALTRTDMEQLWEHSPLKYAPNCKTPTLFIHSDADYRCWMVEGLSMYTALKQNGCDTKLCLFKGETHELSRSGKPKGRARRMEEILGWFDKYLKQ